MKNHTQPFFSLFTVILFSTQLFSQAPEIDWQNTIGGSQFDYGRFIIQTQDGGYLVCGDSNSNMNGDKSEDKVGSADFWIVKLDAFGNIEWDNTIGGHDYDVAYSAIEINEGEYIIAGSSLSNSSGDKSENAIGAGDIWLVKLDSIGNILWDKTIGGTESEAPFQIKNCTDGGFIICAWSRSDDGDKEEESFGLTSDYWVIKFEADGNIQWQNTIGGDGEDYAYCIEQTPDNGYIVGGASYSGISGDKTEDQWGIISPDYWVLKLDSVGNIEWQNTIGTEALDELYDIVITEKGYLLGGYSYGEESGDKTEPTNGSSDYWVLQLDEFGNIEWQKSIGGSSQDQLYSMKKDTGGYYLGGWSTSGVSGDKTDENEGSSDYWILKIDTGGNILWQNTIGGGTTDGVNCISGTLDGSVILVGNSLSDMSGDKTENSMGQYDYWVVKLGCIHSIFYADTDGDGFGNLLDSVSSCTAPTGYIVNNTDCDDSNPAIFPGAVELPDGIDNNCNDTIDEGIVSIPDIENIISVNIFPNPAHKHVTLKIQSVMPSLEIKISIINILGQEIYSQAANLVDGKLTEVIRLHENIASGIFTVRMLYGQKTISENLIVE